jgi:hypothetical protein
LKFPLTELTDKAKIGFVNTSFCVPNNSPRKGTTIARETSENKTDKILKKIFSEASPQ